MDRRGRDSSCQAWLQVVAVRCALCTAQAACCPHHSTPLTIQGRLHNGCAVHVQQGRIHQREFVLD